MNSDSQKISALAKFLIALVALGMIAGLIFLISQKNQQTPSADSQPTPTTLSNSEESLNQLNIKTTKPGAGEEAKPGDLLTVHYQGTLANGVKFDSSLDRGEPFVFQLGAGQVIKGWDLGLIGIKVGEKRKLTVPPELGYGATGIGAIPPNATLIFEVEMLKIN